MHFGILNFGRRSKLICFMLGYDRLNKPSESLYILICQVFWCVRVQRSKAAVGLLPLQPSGACLHLPHRSLNPDLGGENSSYSKNSFSNSEYGGWKLLYKITHKTIFFEVFTNFVIFPWESVFMTMLCSAIYAKKCAYSQICLCFSLSLCDSVTWDLDNFGYGIFLGYKTHLDTIIFMQKTNRTQKMYIKNLYKK